MSPCGANFRKNKKSQRNIGYKYFRNEEQQPKTSTQQTQGPSILPQMLYCPIHFYTHGPEIACNQRHKYKLRTQSITDNVWPEEEATITNRQRGVLTLTVQHTIFNVRQSYRGVQV